MCSSRSFITTAAQEDTSSGLEKALSIMYSRNTLIHLFKMEKRQRLFFLFIFIYSLFLRKIKNFSNKDMCDERHISISN